jgi:hypothetical protein
MPEPKDVGEQMEAVAAIIIAARDAVRAGRFLEAAHRVDDAAERLPELRFDLFTLGGE